LNPPSLLDVGCIAGADIGWPEVVKQVETQGIIHRSSFWEENLIKMIAARPLKEKDPERISFFEETSCSQAQTWLGESPITAKCATRIRAKGTCQKLVTFTSSIIALLHVCA
jgi:hypothetical protein